MSAPDSIKVAVIGGGCAAMAAAFELSRPEHQGRYRITVYQMGWRLGGKGASGRGISGRIEEHGLHIWMGWYENAFRLMRDCYAELDRDPAAPLADWREAFSPLERIGVVDRVGGDDWAHWSAVLPAMDGLPGDPLPEGHQWSVSHYVSRSVQLLLALFQTLQADDPAATGSRAQEATTSPTDLLSRMLRYGELATLGGMIQGISLLGGVLQAASPVTQPLLLDFLDAIAASGRTLIEERLQEETSVRRVWQIIDVIVATLRGVIRFGLVTDTRGFDAIDEYDCREWLRMNGASEASLDSGYMRALYDLGFSYEEGDPTRPSISAGQAIRGTLRTFFTYRGAFFWRMNAGMGDVVFGPLYEVLRRRGVRFEFFHLLRNVRLGNDGHPHVSALEFDIQALALNDAEYRPLVDVGGLPCWPSEPDYAQLVNGEALRVQRPHYESPAASPVVATRELRVSEDFDLVVLGTSLGAIPDVCGEIVESNPRWRRMTEEVRTVATQAFQVWLAEDMTHLGWSGGPVATSGFIEPFDTWADMTHLLPMESWSDPKPRAIAYFCNVLPESSITPEADAQVQANAVRFLERDIRHLWPAIGEDDFPWHLLVAADVALGTGRFASQFWRANIEPSDRYVLSVPGSARHRISPLDRTYDNFTIAGDWTACGFNAGCVEAAVMSGRLAAHALSGLPRLAEIVGYDHP